jgi:hypothetical protein
MDGPPGAAPLEHRRDHPLRGTGAGQEREDGQANRRSAARRLKNAEGGAPRGVRMGTIRAASWLNGSGCYSTRLAALRQPRIAKRPQAGLRAGRIMRHSRAKRSVDPGISGREGAGWNLLRPEMLGSSPSMTLVGRSHGSRGLVIARRCPLLGQFVAPGRPCP